MCDAPVAVTAAVTAPVAATQFAPAQPLIPGSPMQDPVANMTEPNWSGLDVREASALTGDLELPDTAGTAVKEVPLDPPMHMPDAALNQRFLYSPSTSTARSPGRHRRCTCPTVRHRSRGGR